MSEYTTWAPGGNKRGSRTSLSANSAGLSPRRQYPRYGGSPDVCVSRCSTVTSRLAGELRPVGTKPGTTSATFVPRSMRPSCNNRRATGSVATTLVSEARSKSVCSLILRSRSPVSAQPPAKTNSVLSPHPAATTPPGVARALTAANKAAAAAFAFLSSRAALMTTVTSSSYNIPENDTCCFKGCRPRGQVRSPAAVRGSRGEPCLRVPSCRWNCPAAPGRQRRPARQKVAANASAHRRWLPQALLPQQVLVPSPQVRATWQTP